MKHYKKHFNIISGTVAGATLGFIHNNLEGALVGGVLGYSLAKSANKHLL